MELLSQRADVHVNRAGQSVGVFAATIVQKLVPREGAAGLPGQDPQNAKLGRREADFGAVDLHQVVDAIDFDARSRDAFVRSAWSMRPPKQRLDPMNQGLELEGLGDV